MPAPSRPSFVSISKSSSIATSPPSQALLQSDSNQSISDSRTPIAASQTPVPSSVILSNLIPTVLVLIYAVYIIHRIRRYTLLAGIKRLFCACVSLPRNTMSIVWSGERGGNDGYVHANANANVNLNPYHSIEHDEWDQLASYGDNCGEEIELECGQQAAGNGGHFESEGCQHGYQLINNLCSGSDASDAVSDIPLENDGDERVDMSKYFDPVTSRLREGVLLAPGMEIGREDETGSEGRGAKGDITAWIHGSIGRVVASFISWLDD
ncbi:hypothetical protein ACJ73_08751 [Blastomyces percursus]|uniref:Uncharacterized protein n=1 Tax=Blastomyces percursus TaxID=1658174 RepID=A0A1J9QCS6_9EURO|nr:hypothetical protein ACJ73_08751 [Blastomyces percursus]